MQSKWTVPWSGTVHLEYTLYVLTAVWKKRPGGSDTLPRQIRFRK